MALNRLGASSLEEFVGQTEIVRSLRLEVAAVFGASQYTPFPHTLFVAFPGAGKSTLAVLIADELGDELETVVMPVDKAMMSNTLSELGPGRILFLDEIHRATKKQQEELLTVMESGTYRTHLGEEVDVDGATILAATTRPELLDAAVVDRFTLRPRFVPYTEDEMTEIVSVMLKGASLELGHADVVALGAASGGSPRNARRLVLAARTLKRAGVDSDVDAVLRHAGLTYDGLSQEQIEYMHILKGFGGVAGVTRIATGLRMPAAVLPDYERRLFEAGYITYTDKGRALTRAGHQRIKQ